MLVYTDLKWRHRLERLIIKQEERQLADIDDLRGIAVVSGRS